MRLVVLLGEHGRIPRSVGILVMFVAGDRIHSLVNILQNNKIIIRDGVKKWHPVKQFEAIWLHGGGHMWSFCLGFIYGSLGTKLGAFVGI